MYIIYVNILRFCKRDVINYLKHFAFDSQQNKQEIINKYSNVLTVVNIFIW